MDERIIINKLTDDEVIIERQRYVVDEGTEYTVGPPHLCWYRNSVRGRAEIASAVSGKDLDAVLAKWGPEPTVTEEAEE